MAAGAVAIDKSSAFRGDPDVPLVVPEVNAADLAWHKGVIATPNCSTIQLVVALKPLHDAAGVERVVVSTYQSVSGSGKRGVDDLDAQARAWAAGADPELGFYPRPIAFNLLPHIDSLPGRRFHQGGAEDGRRDGQDLRRPEHQGHRHLRARAGLRGALRSGQPADPASRSARPPRASLLAAAPGVEVSTTPAAVATPRRSTPRATTRSTWAASATTTPRPTA